MPALMMFVIVEHDRSSLLQLNLQPYDYVYNALAVIGSFYVILGDQITISTTKKKWQV